MARADLHRGLCPPRLPIETKRKLMRELMEVARVYGRKDLREVLISLDQHNVEDFASNGFRPKTRT